MSQLDDEQVVIEEGREIPLPDPDFEPLKVNVYERMAKAAAMLVPLFPYDHAGAIVPCGSVHAGGPARAYGQFFHWNTVSEVVVCYGANKAMKASGQIIATKNLHAVNSFLNDETDPDAYAMQVITQHQAEDGDQAEAMIARCEKCHAEILRHDYNSTPYGLPGYDEEQYGPGAHPIHQFATAVGSADFADRRNTDEVRTCSACGHLNPPFPNDTWGWHRQVLQTRVANETYQILREAGQAASQSSQEVSSR